MSDIINHGYSRNIEGQNNDLQKKPEQLKQSDKCGSQAQAFRQDLSTSDMVYLYYIEGYSYRKIAKKMGCSPSTVVNRLKTDNAQFELFMLKYACGYGQIIKERHIKKKIQPSKQSIKRGFKAHAFRGDLSTDKMLYLRQEKQYSYKDIAEEMGCSPSTVRNRLNNENLWDEL